MGTLLQHKVAIVTGASSGIGRATAELLGQEGAHVFLVGRSAAPMEQSKAKIEQAGGQASIATFDLRDTTALQSFVGQVYEQQGRLDILVNNAGVQFLSSILDGDPAHWATMLETNIMAVLVGTQAAVRAMRAGGGEGRIVTISSTAALENESGVYGASKHAVNVIMASLRRELERDPIRLTTIMPGVTATNFARSASPEALQDALGLAQLPFPYQQGQHLPDTVLAQIQAMLKQTMCSPEDVARTVLFALTQPIEVNIAELVVRPPVALNIAQRTTEQAAKPRS